MTREDAVKGLRNVADWHYGKYEQTHEEDYLNDGDFLTAVANMLKEQVPRVMTLKELKSCNRETIWFEVKSDHTIKQLTQDGIVALIFIGLLHNWNGCGTIWRCWTSRPDEKRRAETPWRS